MENNSSSENAKCHCSIEDVWPIDLFGWMFFYSVEPNCSLIQALTAQDMYLHNISWAVLKLYCNFSQQTNSPLYIVARGSKVELNGPENASVNNITAVDPSRNSSFLFRIKTYSTSPLYPLPSIWVIHSAHAEERWSRNYNRPRNAVSL